MSIGIADTGSTDHNPGELPPVTIAEARVVGIGASAGGLEALEHFFRGLPGDTGMAFVVVQHLDPTHENHLAELLQHATPMPVRVISDGMRLEANHVFVITPNHDLAVRHGVLRLLEQHKNRGLRLPIDFFFRSLAEDLGKNTLAVILSGMGSDGAAGARAIREKAGRVFVQSPESAKFDGMPRWVINAGLADEVAPAGELGKKIIAALGRPRDYFPGPETILNESDRGELDKLLLMLRARTRHDFTHYKTNTIHRRIERRMLLLRLTRLSEYVRYLRENPSEADLLFKELLIGVTQFFRDPAVWEQLREEVIPALLAARANDGATDDKLRAWVPACSTGEEAFTLAMVFLEARGESSPPNPCSLQVFATDIDKDTVDTARNGLFPPDIAADVGEARLARFFTREDASLRVTKEIREMLVFAAHNLLMDPPFTKLDLISCRNLLIYLDAPMQQKLMSLFHYSLNPGGILVLGSAETVGSASELFEPLPGMNRIFRRRENSQRSLSELPQSPSGRTGPVVPPALVPNRVTVANLAGLTEAALLRHFTPPAALTTAEGDIVFIHGRTGSYLEPAAGKANLNLFSMAREELFSALGEAFARAVRERARVTLPDMRMSETAAVSITILPLAEPVELRGLVLVVFDEKRTAINTGGAGRKVKKADASAGRIAELLAEIQQNRQELLASRVAMQASQEELRSANEELQSSNEELTTSKEEMQSVNEELQTVNQELTVKVDELTLASDDMKNLLNSTEIATLFLDGRLMVRRFTNQITGIIRLIPGDVGRPITDLVTALDYATMADDAREVLRSLVFRETEVPSRDGRWFRVRIMPYRTQDNRIDGVVITFVDITAGKNLEEALRETESILRGRFQKQTTELDTAKALEEVLRKAQKALESRLSARTSELRQSREHSRPGTSEKNKDAGMP